MICNKLPKDIKSRRIHDLQRLADLRDVILRYVDEQYLIPDEYYEEYTELIKRYYPEKYEYSLRRKEIEQN